MTPPTPTTAPDPVALARAAHDDAAHDVAAHVPNCTLGCTWRMAVCVTGQRAAERERATWRDWYMARAGAVLP